MGTPPRHHRRSQSCQRPNALQSAPGWLDWGDSPAWRRSGTAVPTPAVVQGLPRRETQSCPVMPGCDVSTVMSDHLLRVVCRTTVTERRSRGLGARKDGLDSRGFGPLSAPTFASLCTSPTGSRNVGLRYKRQPPCNRCDWRHSLSRSIAHARASIGSCCCHNPGGVSLGTIDELIRPRLRSRL